MNSILEFLRELAVTIPAVLLALTFHEYAHGLVAYKLGDTTAKDAGRLTINPLKHIDPIGLVMMAILHFGWAKPVPINPYKFKNPRTGMALVAAAGPVMNVLLGAVLIFIYYILRMFAPQGAFIDALAQFMAITAMLSIGFAVFNLIPLPPLDGSRVLSLVLPRKWNFFLMKNQRYIHLILIVLLYTNILTVPLGMARNWIISGIETAVQWILFKII